MTLLNQIIAVRAGVKTGAEKAFTGIYHRLQKPAFFDGMSRTYEPLNAEGQPLPAESTVIQFAAEDQLDEIRKALGRYFDVQATQDLANTHATGDIVIDGVALLENVPSAHLLFLEKRLVELRTVIAAMPVLDPAYAWTFNHATGQWETPVVEKQRTAKVPKSHVLYPHSDKHPAQVQPYTVDEAIGTWYERKFSKAMTVVRKAELLDRIETLLVAVITAREAANTVEVTDVKESKLIFDFLFA